MADINKIKIGSTTYNISPSWSNITDKPSSFTPASHTHTKSEVGLGNVNNTADADKNVKYATTAGTADYFKYGRGVMLADSTSFTNNFNKDIFGEETADKFHLVELRTQGNAPSCLLGNHSSGIAWKGADTYGSLMVRWGYPQIRVSGGNGNNTDPKWTVDLIHSNNISSESIKYASSGLGRYDTITENSDGTYTINRQTGYILLDGVIEKNASVTQNGSTSTYRYTFDIVNGYGADGPVISNLLTNISFSDLSNNGRTGIAMYSATRCSICISGITTLADYKSHLAKNNIYVQYKLATATTEKVEKNHYARYNERFILEHNKSEAERSANLLNINDVGSTTTNGITYSIKDGVITLNGTATDNVLIKALCDIKANQSYYLKIFDSPIKLRCYYSNDVNTSFGTLIMHAKEKLFTPTTDVKCLNIWIWKDDTINSNIKPMLVEGSTSPITYQPYNQNKHITNNEAVFLKNEAERSANLLYVPNKTDTSAGVTFTISNGVINVNGSSAASAYPMCEINSVELQAGTYKINKSVDNNGLFIWVGSNPRTNDIANTNGIGETFTITTNMRVYICIVSTQLQTYSNFKFSLMLNEGTEPLPYQPYKGKIVHEKDLKNVSTSLGYYDEVTENIDGTYTITRQTGFHNISIDLFKNGKYRTTQNGHGEYGADTGIHNLPILSGSKNFINNLLTVRDNGEVYAGSIGISITENGMCWVNLGDDYTTTEQYREYFAKNNIYVQYKLAKATTEKVEKNHYARYNQRFILEHNKSEAEEAVNLFDLSNITDDSSFVNPEVIFSYENGGIIIPCGTETGSNNVRLQTFKNNKYISYLGVGEFAEGFSSITFQKTSDFNQIRIKRNGSKKDYGVLFNVNNLEDGKTYTISADVQLRDNTDDRNIYCFHIMIVEGTKAVTEYYHYNAKKHISNNEAVLLKNESERSSNVFNKDLPTLIYGTGYEVPTTANDWIKVYRVPVKGNIVYSSNKAMKVLASSDGSTYNYIGDNLTTFRTESNIKYLCLCIYVGTNNASEKLSRQIFSDLMLNEGSVALPYQPYEGKVIHEKDLKNVSTNLGYYDAMSENDDGTYTITRQTGYLTINREDITGGTHNNTESHAHIFTISKDTKAVGGDPYWDKEIGISSNGYSVMYLNAGWCKSNSIAIDGASKGVTLGFSSAKAQADIQALCPIYVQYKLATATTEKVEKNYCAQYNKRFILEHNKSEAERSSNLWSYENSITINAGSEKWWYLSHDTMVAWGLEVGETYSIKSFVNNNTKDLAFQMLPSYSDFKDGHTFVFTSDTQIRIGGNTVASTVTFTPKITLVKGIDIADEYQPYSGVPIHKKEFEDFKNSMKFIPYVSVAETTSSKDISENGTYFVIPTNPSSASIKLEVKAGTNGTLQTAYFSGGIISVYRNYDRRFQVCEVKIVYGAGSTAASTYILDSASYSSLPSGILAKVTGKCKIYKLN